MASLLKLCSFSVATVDGLIIRSIPVTETDGKRNVSDWTLIIINLEHMADIDSQNVVLASSGLRYAKHL